jgi:hypothetical protein
MHTYSHKPTGQPGLCKNIVTVHQDSQHNADIQGWATNHGLNCILQYIVFLKLMVALKITGCCVLGCCLSLYSMKAPFFLSRWPPGGGELNSRSCGCIPLLTGPIPWRWTDVGHPDLHEHSLAFCLQNLPDSEVQ